ncbi:type II secretion system protein GspM [Polaromonas sp.]|jgi:general secretion pathway protein M|uniref:type II secretion system protein GspM n=1 Tax=Polaromonas sp. TaxID=1869339 RepID=UPI001E0C09E5|nr:type II secretion system protein GspM [Polaromonas sp.]MBT9477335.1 type II secretion system protein M [Polaromonas sp.]
MSLPPSIQSLQARWAQLQAREKSLLALAAGLVLVTLLWQLSLAPALTTLRTADDQARALNAQLQQMQAMQTEARALQQQPTLGFDEALRALTLATEQTLGATARLNTAGDRTSVTLQGASADALAQWLAQARLNARSVPAEARLVRAVAPGAPGGATWNGVLVMQLPAR